MKHLLRLSMGLLLLTSAAASADPCEMALGKVDPGGAAAARADEMQARQRVQEEVRHVEGQDGDAQYKGRDAADILRTAASHHSKESGLYGAGIAKAMMMGDIATAMTLSQCVAKRTGQSVVDNQAAEKNEYRADHVTKEDTDGYAPKVVTVDAPKPAPKIMTVDAGPEVVRIQPLPRF